MELQQKYVIKCPDGSIIIDPPRQDFPKLDLNTCDISEHILNPFKASEAVLNKIDELTQHESELKLKIEALRKAKETG